MGRAVGGGVTWIVLATAMSKVAMSITQIMMGWLLTKQEFGLFATASAMAGMLALCRDAGASSLMVQRRKEYEQLAGPLLWMGTTASVVSGLIVAGLAWPLAHYVYKDDALFPLLLVLAAALPLGTPGLMLRAKMRMDLHFESYSKQEVCSSLVRQGSMLLFALAGLKSMSLALPSACAGVYDTISAFLFTREKFWRRRANLRLWPKLLKSSRWIMFGLLANALLDQGPYFIMGVMLAIQFGTAESQEITGVFFFAFQITAQLAILLGYGLQQVLFPVLTRLNDEPKRQADAIVRSLHALMILGSFSCLLLAAVMDPIEKIVWHGRWNAAVLPVIILGIAFPWRITFGLTFAVMHAQGRFKRHAWMTLFEGLGLLAATALACSLPGMTVEQGASRVAIWTGGWLIVSRLIVTLFALKKSGVGATRVLGAVFPAWILGMLAAAAAFGADWALGPADLVRGWLGESRVAETVAQSSRLLTLGTACTLCFCLGARIALRDQLVDALRVAPMRLRGPACLILGVRIEQEQQGGGAAS